MSGIIRRCFCGDTFVPSDSCQSDCPECEAMMDAAIARQEELERVFALGELNSDAFFGGVR